MNASNPHIGVTFPIYLRVLEKVCNCVLMIESHVCLCVCVHIIFSVVRLSMNKFSMPRDLTSPALINLDLMYFKFPKCLLLKMYCFLSLFEKSSFDDKSVCYNSFMTLEVAAVAQIVAY